MYSPPSTLRFFHELTMKGLRVDRAYTSKAYLLGGFSGDEATSGHGSAIN